MSLTDRSRRSHPSSASDGLTHVTDDPELRGATSDGDCWMLRPIRGYDPVFSYHESDGAAFKAGSADAPQNCHNWHENASADTPKSVSRFVRPYFRSSTQREAQAETARLSRLSMGDAASPSSRQVSFSPVNTRSEDGSSNSQRQTRSSNQAGKSARMKGSKGTRKTSVKRSRPAVATGEAGSNASLSGGADRSSGGFSRRSGRDSQSFRSQSSSTRSRSVSNGSGGNASRHSASGSENTSWSQERPLIRSKSTLARSGGAQSDSSSRAHSLTSSMLSSRTRPSARRKREGVFGKIVGYFSDRKQRTQKEYRRKERHRELPQKSPGESCQVWLKKRIRTLVQGQPLGDPTVAGQYGAPGNYRPFTGHMTPDTASGTMTSRSSAGSLPTSAQTGDRAAYGKEQGVIVCSQRRAIVIMCLIFTGILVIALIAAFARPACVDGGSVVGPSTVAPPVVTPPTTPDGQLFPWDDVRLPDNVVPYSYVILMRPNLTTLSVIGQVHIDVTVARPADFVVLHSRNMTITEPSLRRISDSANMSITKLLFYPARDQMYLALNESLPQGQNYSLFFKFSYTLKEELEGFYLSHYISPSGAKVRLATTHFEPTAARAAFPCFDEPQLKATFKLSMVRHQRHTVLFNTPRNRTEDLGIYIGTGIKRDDFYETVRMSTYLVAFVVSDFAHISGTAANGDVLVSVWAPPHLVQQGQFARDIAISCLNFYADYFGIPYQLPKIDLVAIPDFGAGAMENWGLVTFRDTSLLYDASQTSSALQEWVALVVAHELAHQWFGNLVTMKWWNDLWLNEGFATLMEFMGAGNAKPEYHMAHQFMLKASLTALSLDSLSDSHPISVPVTNPDEIESIFDAISYSKGAALLYMLMRELGQPVFKAGLNRYLSSHQFGNAETDDLWAALQEASRQARESAAEDGEGERDQQLALDVKAMMDSWTLQKNYPLITAQLEAGQLSLTQTPFVMLINASAATSQVVTEPRWYVPVRCRLSQTPAAVLAVRLNLTRAVTVPVEGEHSWYFCNVNKTGLYRVTYPQQNWAALDTLLHSGSRYLSTEDRGAIIDDAFSLNRADRLNATVALGLSTALLTERSLVPWTAAGRHLMSWLSLTYDLPEHVQLEAFQRRLIRGRYNELGWLDTGSHLIRQQRSLVLQWAVTARLPDAVTRAKTLFNDWKAGLAVPPDLRKLVYASGVEFGDDSDWQFVWERYVNATIPSEKKSLLWALGSSQNPLILEKFLRRSLEGDKIRAQDFASIIESVASNEAGRLRLWRFIRLYWPEVVSKFGNGAFMIDSIIQDLVSGFTTQLELDEVEVFFRGKDLKSAARALQLAIESVRLNIRWRQKHRAEVARWLRQWLQEHDAAAAAAAA